MRQIPEHPDYSVTKQGRIWSHKNERWLVPQITEGQRKYVVLGAILKPVDCLMLQAFISPQPGKITPKHLNDSQDDCRLKNLQWGDEPRPKGKLMERDKRAIVAQYATGQFTQQELATLYDVSQRMISDAVNEPE